MRLAFLQRHVISFSFRLYHYNLLISKIPVNDIPSPLCLCFKLLLEIIHQFLTHNLLQLRIHVKDELLRNPYLIKVIVMFLKPYSADGREHFTSGRDSRSVSATHSLGRRVSALGLLRIIVQGFGPLL